MSFPQSVRSTGIGVVYALGVTIFGGSTQFVVAWLIDATRDPMIPAWYQIAANIAAIIGVVLMTPHPEVVEASVLARPRVLTSRGTGPLEET